MNIDNRFFRKKIYDNLLENTFEGNQDNNNNNNNNIEYNKYRIISNGILLIFIYNFFNKFLFS